jgi:hypothetical protein
MPNLFDGGTVRFLSESEPMPVYMWPEIRPNKPDDPREMFVFQYWPETLEDAYTPNWSEKPVPGGSHPLQQWTGGSGRALSFTAIFTTEIEPGSVDENLVNVTQSFRYNVDVRAALAKLNSYMRPGYPGGTPNSQATEPPPRLYLHVENTRLGGDSDTILVILKGASVTYQAWFPQGYPRIAEVALQFSEVVQHHSDGPLSNISFIGRTPFYKCGLDYKYRGAVDKILGDHAGRSK